MKIELLPLVRAVEGDIVSHYQKYGAEAERINIISLALQEPDLASHWPHPNCPLAHLPTIESGQENGGDWMGVGFGGR